MSGSNMIDAVIVAVLIAAVIYARNRRESRAPRPEDNGERYRPYVPGWGYLVLLFMLALRLGMTYREGDLTRMLAQLFLDSAAFISLYYLILLLILILLDIDDIHYYLNIHLIYISHISFHLNLFHIHYDMTNIFHLYDHMFYMMNHS